MTDPITRLNAALEGHYADSLLRRALPLFHYQSSIAITSRPYYDASRWRDARTPLVPKSAQRERLERG